MNYCWLILIFGVGCSAAIFDRSNSFEDLTISEDAERNGTAEIEAQFREFVTEVMDVFFENFTDILQDRHPSVAGPIKNLTTFVQKKGYVPTLKNLLIDAQVLLAKKSNVTERSDFCRNNGQKIMEISQSPLIVMTPENAAFLSTLWRTANFMLDDFCSSPQPFQFFNFAEDVIADLPEFHNPIAKFIGIVNGNDTVPSEEHYCLPLRVAEGYEIAAIRTHKIPFLFHGSIGEAYHFFATIVGYFPFKTVQECDI